jgi:hypothetical protein
MEDVKAGDLKTGGSVTFAVVDDLPRKAEFRLISNGGTTYYW